MAKSKAGRNKVKCQNYRANRTRELNKERRLKKRLATFAKRAANRAKRESANADAISERSAP